MEAEARRARSGRGEERLRQEEIGEKEGEGRAQCKEEEKKECHPVTVPIPDRGDSLPGRQWLLSSAIPISWRKVSAYLYGTSLTLGLEDTIEVDFNVVDEDALSPRQTGRQIHDPL